MSCFMLAGPCASAAPAMKTDPAFQARFITDPVYRGKRALSRLSDVLHFFFELDAEPVEAALLQVLDDGTQFGSGAAAGVVDEVGVIVGHANPAALHALRANLFQKIRRRHLAFAHHFL